MTLGTGPSSTLGARCFCGAIPGMAERRACAGVIGWSKDFIHGAAFHDMPQVHDDNPVSEITHDPRGRD